MLYEANKLDLSKSGCHICGGLLERNFGIEKEWCNNPKCQLYEIRFSIPYKVKTKSARTAKDIIKGMT